MKNNLKIPFLEDIDKVDLIFPVKKIEAKNIKRRKSSKSPQKREDPNKKTTLNRMINRISRTL